MAEKRELMPGEKLTLEMLRDVARPFTGKYVSVLSLWMRSRGSFGLFGIHDAKSVERYLDNLVEINLVERAVADVGYGNNDLKIYRLKS